MVTKRFQSTEELVRTDKQGEEKQTKDSSKDDALPVPLRVRDDLQVF